MKRNDILVEYKSEYVTMKERYSVLSFESDLCFIKIAALDQFLGVADGLKTTCLAGRVLFWDLLPPKMVSKTVIWVGYPAQLMVPDGARSLVVTMSGHDSHSSMFWVFFRLLHEQ